MTPNKSLDLTCRIQDLMRQDLLQFIEPIFPKAAISDYQQEHLNCKQRERVFTPESTLLTMIITSFQADKSLQNSVNIFQNIHNKNNDEILKQEQERVEKLRLDIKGKKPHAGRPPKFEVKLPISKTKEISSNTAGYSKARSRVDLALIETTYEATKDDTDLLCVKKWHGRTVYNTDGTYFQMQDTKSIGEKYRAQKNKDGTLQGYPQGLLQVLTQHGSGFISAYKIAGRTESELHVAPDLVRKLPPKSLLLADDLYSSYAFLAFMTGIGQDIIVPDKKDRRYNIIEEIDIGDQIIEIKKPSDVNPLFQDQKIPDKLKMRRITYRDTENPEKSHYILTTLEPSIPSMEIVMKYSSRWDIEITIREIKTLMDTNIARGKTEEMVFKEIGVELVAYNLLKRIIVKSVDETDFSPETNLFQKLFAPYKNTLVDKKGRVYSRWASGRPADYHQGNKETQDSISTGPSLFTKNKGGEISEI